MTSKLRAGFLAAAIAALPLAVAVAQSAPSTGTGDSTQSSTAAIHKRPKHKAVAPPPKIYPAPGHTTVKGDRSTVSGDKAATDAQRTNNYQNQ